jgi:hypothetical protein
MPKPDCESSYIRVCSEELKIIEKWTARHLTHCDKIPKWSYEDLLSGKLGMAPSAWWEVIIRPNTIGYDARVRCVYCGTEKSVQHDHD